jgi:NMD protein affecting ribosome stability and mRNA decay
MPRRHIKPGAQPVYRTKPLLAHLEDSYKARGKFRDPTVCPECGAVFHKGKWQWQSKPESAHSERCPACHRVHDRMPAGYIKLKGEFFKKNRSEILNLVNNVEHKEKGEHPLQRIMNIGEEGDSVMVTTTDIHLAHGIGESIRRAYQGQLKFDYNTEENLLRVTWSR